MSLRGKVCLVTGATRGIGHGIALQLGEAGATVYITGIFYLDYNTDISSVQFTTQELLNVLFLQYRLSLQHRYSTSTDSAFILLEIENGI
jgi:enoyl-[acyl-carrier-protein] reductase (NADH)